MIYAVMGQDNVTVLEFQDWRDQTPPPPNFVPATAPQLAALAPAVVAPSAIQLAVATPAKIAAALIKKGILQLSDIS